MREGQPTAKKSVKRETAERDVESETQLGQLHQTTLTGWCSCRSHSTWDEFRRWLLERIVESSLFKGAMEPWINTELLCVKYRC